MKAMINLFRLVFLGVGAAFVSLSIPALGAVANISVADFSFTPATTNIHTGDLVIWTWASGAKNHNVVSTSTPFAWLFSSPDGSPGTTSNQSTNNLRNSPFSFTNVFDSTGFFPYECAEHVSKGMVGAITVMASAVPPSVAITNPVAGEVFSAPANLTIQAAASDSSGTVTNVQFLIDSTVLTNSATAPFFATINNLATGTYTFSAIASGDNGLSATNSITVSVVTPDLVVTEKPAFASPGHFQFSYSANIGLTYVVQVSTNLLNWTSLATNTATVNPEGFTDPNASGSAAFYRVERLPNP
jgi:plastocyanin